MSVEMTPEMRRSFLIAALRDEALWPKGFEWYFGNCRFCGMGLLNRLCNLGLPVTLKESLLHGEGIADWVGETAKVLGLGHEDTRMIFDPGPDCIAVYGTDMAIAIGPKAVADRLEKLHQLLKEERSA